MTPAVRPSFYQRSESVCSLATPQRQPSANPLSAPPGMAKGISIADKRPLQDKAWRYHQSVRIRDFLQIHGYDRVIDAKAFASCPSTSEVDAVLRFLFELLPLSVRLEPHQALDGEVLGALMKKLLKYPYKVPVANKQVHVTPVAWPALFGAVLWLVERCEMITAHKAAQRERLDSVDTLGAPSRLTTLLLHCNAERLRGDPNWNRPLEMLLYQAEMTKDGEVRARDQAQHTLEKLRRDLHELKAQPDDLAQILAQRNAMEKDLDTLSRYLGSLRQHISDLEASERDQLASRDQKEADVRDLQTRKQQLQSGIASQKLTRSDEERILRETRGLMGQLSHWEAKLQERDGQLRDVEEHLQRKLLDLAAACSEFNQAAAALALVPAGAKHSGGRDLTARVLDVERLLQPPPPGSTGDTTATLDAPKVVSLDFKADVQPALEHLGQLHGGKVAATQAELERIGRQCTELAAALEHSKAAVQQAAAELQCAQASAQELDQQAHARRHLEEEVRQREETYALEKHRLAEAISATLMELMTYKERLARDLADFEAQEAQIARALQ